MAATNGNTSADPAAAPSQVVDVDTLSEDVARLDLLLSQSENDASDDADVAELLQHLEMADGVASDLEIKLNGILAKLDDILLSVEVTKQETVEVEITERSLPIGCSNDTPLGEGMVCYHYDRNHP
ncbi:hypothetical protein LshimejAT787_1401200 [Lyophyllum shimeji]|uniref:Uncharacterized protein n=1 Tax=Lyophyllum shimeji TaxID=47721 RepID=A0A9P3PXX9_LYOSH|nr:hypothetical protein LshimejAT787_1401200 [Lyophyllum shimeji]